MSGKVHFIADLHLGHRNMAIKRGFTDEFAQDEYIISQWNKVVDKGDVVWILGDLFMESKKYFFRLDELKGMKKVILGNHCMMSHVPELLKYVNGVAGMMKYKHKEYGNFWLTHCPVHPRELDYRVKWSLHGHLHEHIILDADGEPDERYINVSCEQVDYTPRTLDELMIGRL